MGTQKKMNAFKSNFNLVKKKETTGLSLSTEIKMILSTKNKKMTIIPKDVNAVKKEYEQ